MRILSIQLKNIKSHRDTLFSFSAGINVLSGPNGVGKSTIFEAIGYALFGVDARDFVSNVDRFLSIGAKRGEISVRFLTNSAETWQVSRTVGAAAKWLLARERNGSFEVEEHARVEETEVRIAELLGLNNGRPLADQFKLVIGPFQNEFLGPFIIRQPVKRQEAFDEILGIDAWRKTYKGTSGLLSAVQERINVLTAEVRLLQEQLAVLPQRQEELTAAATLLYQRQGELHARQTTLDALETTLAVLDNRERAVTALNAEIFHLDARVRDGNEKIAGQRQRVEEAQRATSIVAESRAGKEACERAEALLIELRGREQQRRALEQEINGLEQETRRLTQTMEHEQAEIARTDNQLNEEENRLTATRQAIRADETFSQLAARLPDLRRAVEHSTVERSQLAGKRDGLMEGSQKLAEGICPFFQEQCLNITDRTSRDVFSAKIAELDHAMSLLEARGVELGQQLLAAEQAQQELHAHVVRRQELDKQLAALAERRNQNRERNAKLLNLAEQRSTAASRLAERNMALQAFATLDGEIERAEAERSTFQTARDTFNLHRTDADDLDNRRQTLDKWQAALDELHRKTTEKRTELAGICADYQPERHREVRGERDHLLSEVATHRQQIEELGKNCRRLDEELGKLRLLQEAASARLAEISSCVEKEKLVKFLRTQIFKNVSTQLSERFREEISLRADRIYRTIAESDEELVWGDNYQIMLRDMADGAVRVRSDDQLSGGQTMSAVVALRLALLQTIGARIAFFDEPTSNLDAARRENLAHAFQAIDAGSEEVSEHWYDQLFLISHDVAFTEITDQILQVGA